MLFDRHRELRGEAVAGGGRTVKIGAGRLERDRFSRLEHGVGGVEIELHAFRQEFLDPQGHALHRFSAGRVGAEFDLPAAGRRFGRNQFLEAVVALRTGFDPAFDEGFAVRLIEAHEQRLGLVALHRHRLAIVVAQQRGETHDLAGAIEVAAGPGEHIEPRRFAPAHREFGQIQRRLIERQQRDVLAAARNKHVRRLQLVGQHRVAVAVGLGLEDGFARAVQHLQFDAGDGAAVLQRRGMDEELVLVRAHVQADIADGEEGGFELVVELAGALHHREVQAGLLQFLDILDRQISDDTFVALAAEHETVGVDRFREFGQRRVVAVLVVQLPAAAAAAALVFIEELRQRLLAHAQELDVDLGHVHRHHRQAAAFARRQHAALRGEPGGRLQFAGVDLLLDVAAERAAVGSGELRRNLEGVFAVRRDERVAEDLAAVVELPAALLFRRRVECDQLIEVLRADHRSGELQRDRQRVAVLIGIGPDQGEALDLIALGLDGLAADFGQLPGFLVAAARQGRQCEHQTRPPHPRHDLTANPTQHCEPRRATHMASWICGRLYRNFRALDHLI